MLRVPRTRSSMSAYPLHRALYRRGRTLARPVGALWWAAAALLLVPAVGMSAHAGGNGTPGGPRGMPVLAPGALKIRVNLSEATVPFPLSPMFWGTTVTPRAALIPNEGLLVNATPTRVVVWPGANAGDDYDPLNNTLVHATTSAVTWTAPATSEAEFVDWCRSIACTAIFQVPGEIDNISIAEAVVRYTEENLSFHPAYWEIGNEPELWKEWGRPWAQWDLPAELGVHRVTPNQYAWELHNFTLALRSVDPSIRILGLAGTGRAEDHLSMTDWINATVALDGANLSGIAIHVYPASVGVQNLTSYFGEEQAQYGLPDRVALARATIASVLQTTCPGCPPLPVFVTETGSALAHFTYGNDSVGFPGALAMTRIALQGIDLNLSMLANYAAVMTTTNSWFDLRGEARPAYSAYSEILSHLGPEVYPTTIQVPNGTTYNGSNSSLAEDLDGVATVAPGAGNRSDLVLVNVNLTTNVTLAPLLPGISASTPVELWEWQGRLVHTPMNNTTWVHPSTQGPTPTFFPAGLPKNWTLPALTVALFEGFPTPGAPVELNETGLPAGTRWFAVVDGGPVESGGPHRTVFLERGVHPLTIPILPAATPGRLGDPRARFAPFGPSVLTVSSVEGYVAVPFVPQWAVEVQASPLDWGTVSPEVAWANASMALGLSAVPAPGFVFVRWTGWGSGSSNTTLPQTAIDPKGPVEEVAHFARGYDVEFLESGLPPYSPWTVTVQGTEDRSMGSSLMFLEGNGTYGFSVGAPDGFRPVPRNSSFRVSGSGFVVEVQFIALRPPPDTFPVEVSESGLPIGTPWTVLLRDVPYESVTSHVTVFEANGSYGYSVLRVPGYQARPPAGGFSVNGTATRLALTFVPERAAFPTMFVEAGLWSNVSWWAVVDGARVNGTRSWIALELLNGTHRFAIGADSGFAPTPRVGSFLVAGGTTNLSVAFALPMVEVRVAGRGLPTGTAWEFRLADDQFAVETGVAEFREPNGTYTWDAEAPSGFHAMASHGNLTVQARSTNLSLDFLPNGPGPRPPAGPLERAALGVAVAMGAVGAGVFLSIGAIHRALARRPARRPHD